MQSLINFKYMEIHMQLIMILKIVTTYLPLIIQLIKTVEQQFPDAGIGQVKLDTIRGMLEAAFDQADDFTNKFEDIWPVLEKTIGKVVAFMNTTGQFKKSA